MFVCLRYWNRVFWMLTNLSMSRQKVTWIPRWRRWSPAIVRTCQRGQKTGPEGNVLLKLVLFSIFCLLASVSRSLVPLWLTWSTFRLYQNIKDGGGKKRKGENYGEEEDIDKYFGHKGGKSKKFKSRWDWLHSSANFC